MNPDDGKTREGFALVNRAGRLRHLLDSYRRPLAALTLGMSLAAASLGCAIPRRAMVFGVPRHPTAAV